MPLNLLLVEPDERLREFWRETLSHEGFKVIPSTETGASSVEPVPDLVFVGSGFEGEKAIALLERLKARRADIVVIAPLNSLELKAELEAIERSGRPTTRIQIEPVRVAIRQALRTQAAGVNEFPEFVSSSPAMREVKRAIAQLLKAETTTVLLQGETGTGKELVAHTLHAHGKRQAGPFITLNCTQIPETLFESELFGYEPGAFTDAKQAKAGLLELANGGTVFLDEIGDMPPMVQAKFLTVLEEKRFRRLGGKAELTTDLRVIAATNQDLGALVEAGRFREDLYHRLCVFPITMPPLRDRLEDLLPLAQHFIQFFAREFRKEIRGLTPSAEAHLRNYHWPGNVRELRNVIERAAILEQGAFLTPASLRLTTDRSLHAPTTHAPMLHARELSLNRMEREMIEAALQRARGNQTEAARFLGISRFALRNRLKKYQMFP